MPPPKRKTFLELTDPYERHMDWLGGLIVGTMVVDGQQCKYKKISESRFRVRNMDGSSGGIISIEELSGRGKFFYISTFNEGKWQKDKKKPKVR